MSKRKAPKSARKPIPAGIEKKAALIRQTCEAYAEKVGALSRPYPRHAPGFISPRVVEDACDEGDLLELSSVLVDVCAKQGIYARPIERLTDYMVFLQGVMRPHVLERAKDEVWPVLSALCRGRSRAKSDDDWIPKAVREWREFSRNRGKKRRRRTPRLTAIQTRTVEVYAKNDGDVRKTAQELNKHPKTVRDALKAAERKLGIDLSDRIAQEMEYRKQKLPENEHGEDLLTKDRDTRAKYRPHLQVRG
jgi:hypothetical protein